MLICACCTALPQDEARKRGLKVIIVFADNWYPVNGVTNYVKWAKGDGAAKELFFTDGAVESLYKRNIDRILNRRNTFNGRKYKDDPTIMYALAAPLAALGILQAMLSPAHARCPFTAHALRCACANDSLVLCRVA